MPFPCRERYRDARQPVDTDDDDCTTRFLLRSAFRNCLRPWQSLQRSSY
jgi:hypothetical protein